MIEIHFFSTLHTPKYWSSRVVPFLKYFNKDFSELITFDDGLVMSIGKEKSYIPKTLLDQFCEDHSICYIKYSSTGQVVSYYFTPEDKPKTKYPVSEEDICTEQFTLNFNDFDLVAV